MAKEEENTDMETRVIEAAKQVFVRKGYNQTTMSDVAREAGIGRTALHYYFRTKEMLFQAIFGQLMELILPNIKRIVEEETNIFDKLDKVIDQYLQALQSNLLFPIFAVSEMNRDPNHLYQVVLKDPNKIMPLLRLKEEINQEMEKGNIRKVKLPDLVSTLIGMIAFPLLVRYPLSSIFFEGDMEQFRQYVAERGPFIKDAMRRMLTPDNE